MEVRDSQKISLLHGRFHDVIHLKSLTPNDFPRGCIHAEEIGDPHSPFELARRPSKREFGCRMDDLFPRLIDLENVADSEAGHFPGVEIQIALFDLGNRCRPIEKIELTNESIKNLVQTELDRPCHCFTATVFSGLSRAKDGTPSDECPQRIAGGGIDESGLDPGRGKGNFFVRCFRGLRSKHTKVSDRAQGKRLNSYTLMSQL